MTCEITGKPPASKTKNWWLPALVQRPHWSGPCSGTWAAMPGKRPQCGSFFFIPNLVRGADSGTMIKENGDRHRPQAR